MARLFAASLFAVAVAACYETPKPACQFLCGDGEACPADYACGDDQRCHRVEANGDLAACTDELPPVPDASIDGEPVPPDGTPVCAAGLTTVSDGTSAARQALVISEVDPGAFIEVYNNSGAELDLGASTIALHSPPSGSLALSTTALVIPAGGFRTIAWPAAFTDTDAGGEILLYLDASDFDDGAKIMDFVPWGTAPTGSRQTLAEASTKWFGARPGALTMGAIQRNAAADGLDAADYTVTAAATPINCDP